MESKKHDAHAKPVKFVIVSECLDSVSGKPTVKPDAAIKSIFEEPSSGEASTFCLNKVTGGQEPAEESKTANQDTWTSIVLGSGVGDHVPHELSAQTNPVEEHTEPTTAPDDAHADSSTEQQSHLHAEADEVEDQA